MPWKRPNGTPSSDAAIVDRSAAVVWAGLPPANVPVMVIDVPGAATRSCLTAWGSAWPANTARAAPTAAATSVVSAAAASTTQCADMRAATVAPADSSLASQFRILQHRGKSGQVTNRCRRQPENGPAHAQVPCISVPRALRWVTDRHVPDGQMYGYGAFSGNVSRNDTPKCLFG